MANERIKLDMTIEDAIMAISGGNPGAMMVCMELIEHGDKVDPDAFAGGFANLLVLDMLNIWEDRIWALYKDVCGGHLGKMIAVILAYQLDNLAGVDEDALNYAIDNHGAGINIDAVVEAVRRYLPNFNPEAVAVN